LKFDLTTDRRIAAAIGQFLVEAGDSFQELEEDLDYTSAARLAEVYPLEFPPSQTPSILSEDQSPRQQSLRQ
jgi:hypothetical protein